MNTIKVMGIIGIAFAVFSFFCIAGFESSDPAASSGWGIIACAFLLATSIVSVVQSKRHTKLNK